MQEYVWGDLPLISDCPCIVVDLDSTLCNNDHRASLVPSNDKYVEYEKVEDRNSWEKFFLAAKDDTPYECVKSLIQAMSEYTNVVILTARENKYLQTSVDWLKEHSCEYTAMFHKPDDCKRTARDYKVSMLPEIEKTFGKILFCLEDQTSIVKAIRAAGYVAFDVRNAYND